MSELETAADRLTSSLKRSILRGEYAPGEKLPPERELAEKFEVNRVTVRGALARLESLNLVTIRHGSGCVVQDYRRSGGLELVAALCDAATRDRGADVAEMAADLLEIRRSIARTVLERMSTSSDDRAIARISAGVDALEKAVTSGAPLEDIARADLEVFRRIVEATGSVVYLLCLNPVAELVIAMPGLADAIYAEPYQNVLSYRLLLSWLTLKKPEMLAPIMQALEAHDRAAVKTMRKKARK